MNEVELLESLLELAGEASLEVRLSSRRLGGEAPPPSGICRVREKIWVVLSHEDPVSFQIEVLGEALKSHAGAMLEERYLPPAVRAFLGGDSASSADSRDATSKPG